MTLLIARGAYTAMHCDVHLACKSRHTSAIVLGTSGAEQPTDGVGCAVAASESSHGREAKAPIAHCARASLMMAARD
jgi:hypothetical protein